MLTHDEMAKLIDQYHEIAIKHYERNPNIKISRTKNVQITDDGAFVEAVVWVPKKELTR